MQAGYPKMFIPVKYREKYYNAIDVHNEKRYKEYCNKLFEVMIEQITLKK